MKAINVLSGFNGMGCIWYALDRNNIKVNKRYSVEIDKYANEANDAAYSDTIQLGDITNVKAKNLEKIDLFVGGSPCQGFSFAGKQLAFEDPRSKLFFEFVRLWNEIKAINPNAKFLLENVQMKKNELRIISEYMGVFPVNINSNLVSAQNRNRWYWTNIKTKQVGLFDEVYTDIPQPKDKGILLKDILQPESEINEKYYISNVAIARIIRKTYSHPKINPNKAGTLNTKNNSAQLSVDSGTTLVSDRGPSGQYIFSNHGKVGALSSRNGCAFDNAVIIGKDGNKKANQDKAGCLTGGGHSGGNHSDMDIICVSMVGRRIDENGVRKDNDKTIQTVQQLEPVQNENKTNCLTSVSKDNLIMQINPSKESGGKQPYQQNRIYHINGQMPALNAELGGRNNIAIACDYRKDEGLRIKTDGKTGTLLSRARNDESCGRLAIQNFKLRRLTPYECGKLQTFTDSELKVLLNSGISDTQLYKMLGNGWTVDVIAHILSFLK